MLVVAQVLKSDVPAYRGLPDTPEAQREYALHQYDELIHPEFEKTTAQLISKAKHLGGQAMRLGQHVAKEQQEIIAAFQALDQANKSELPAKLNDLGYQLAAHVRFKERVFFTALQEDPILPDVSCQ